MSFKAGQKVQVRHRRIKYCCDGVSHIEDYNGMAILEKKIDRNVWQFVSSEARYKADSYEDCLVPLNSINKKYKTI